MCTLDILCGKHIWNKNRNTSKLEATHLCVPGVLGGLVDLQYKVNLNNT